MRSEFDQPFSETNHPKINNITTAPQLKFAEDGSIIINEESLLIHRENIEATYDETIIESEKNDTLTYNSYRKFHHTKKWSEKETAKFYKALSMIGTDFTMIQRLFSNRSRDEIKRKFKREEKLNQALIDRVLCNQCFFFKIHFFFFNYFIKIQAKTSEVDLAAFISSESEETDIQKSNSQKFKRKTKLKRIEKSKSDYIPLKTYIEDNLILIKYCTKGTFIESSSENSENGNNMVICKTIFLIYN